MTTNEEWTHPKCDECNELMMLDSSEPYCQSCEDEEDKNGVEVQEIMWEGKRYFYDPKTRELYNHITGEHISTIPIGTMLGVFGWCEEEELEEEEDDIVVDEIIYEGKRYYYAPLTRYLYNQQTSEEVGILPIGAEFQTI